MNPFQEYICILSKYIIRSEIMKQINIALLGLGTVGTGVVQILKENHEQIKEKLNTDIRITWILVSDVTKPRSIETAHYQLTDNIEDIKNDDTIDMYVEVMGGIENTKEILLYALNQKKHVITANKDLLAERSRRDGASGP